ncbi:MAG TPA: multicopper oxidase domain-containing protein [Longimicrobium sp.]
MHIRTRSLAVPALLLALLAGAGVSQAAAQSGAACTPRPTPPADTTALPAIVQASNVAVSVAITPATATIGGCRFQRNLYRVAGGAASYLPATLRIFPGASLDLTVTNGISAAVDTSYHGTTTNFHFHGFNVTPGRGSGAANVGDQVVSVSYDSGQAHAYRFTLPASHPMGMHWYHPHPHGFTDEQVGGGLSGAILVGDIRALRLPKNLTMPEKVLLVKDFQPFGANAFGGSVFTINGDWPAAFTIPTGTAQLWHVGNVGSDTYAGLALVNQSNPADSLALIVLAMDGNGLVKADTVRSLTLSPAIRYDVVVQAPNTRGAVYNLVNTVASTAVNGKVGAVLGTLATTGPAQNPAPGPLYIAPDPGAQSRVSSVANAAVDSTLQFVFSFNAGALPDSQFQINQQPYEPARIDVRVMQGITQDWTLVNADTSGPHVFHIHQGDFLVMSTNGTSPARYNSVQDRLSIAAGDTVVVRIPFDESFQTGLYVFHCHILFHEDHGMMKNVCVYPQSEKGDGGASWCQDQLSASAHH